MKRKQSACLLASMLLPGVLLGWPSRAGAQSTNLTTIEQMLPAYEQYADDCEAALNALPTPYSPAVQDDVNEAMLRINALRSIPTIIQKDPSYFNNSIKPSNLVAWKQGWDYFLACAQAGADSFAGMTSGTRAYVSPIDGGLLFYELQLPADYTPSKTYPLLVLLHPGGAYFWEANGVGGAPSNNPKYANSTETITIHPFGRGSNSYAGMGEASVLEALADAEARYPIDLNRILVGGASMGAVGGFRFGCFYPDLFAACYSITGDTDYMLPKYNGMFDPIESLCNYANIGVCIWDAPKDLSYTQNEQVASDLSALQQTYPGYYPYVKYTDPNGKHGVIDPTLLQEGWDWMWQQVRNPYPAQVIYQTYWLRYSGAYWAYVDGVVDPTKPALIQANLTSGPAVSVNVENVTNFHLNLVPQLVGSISKVAVTINGTSLNVPTGGEVDFAYQNGSWTKAASRYGSGLVKRPGLSGPVLDAFMQNPVLMVYGTTAGKSDAQQNAMVDAALMNLLGPGDGAVVYHTPFNRKQDVQVTSEDIANDNLVLFGTPQTNALLASVAGSLPISFLSNGIQVGSSQYTGNGVGLVMIYPNPLNQNNYILILPENYGSYTGLQPSSLYKFPDYMVIYPYSTSLKPNQMRILKKGTFSSSWSL